MLALNYFMCIGEYNFPFNHSSMLYNYLPVTPQSAGSSNCTCLEIACWVIFHNFLTSADSFLLKINFFKKSFRSIPSLCQTVLTQIRPIFLHLFKKEKPDFLHFRPYFFLNLVYGFFFKILRSEEGKNKNKNY